MLAHLAELTLEELGIFPCVSADAQMHKSLCIVRSCRSHLPSLHCVVELPVKGEDMKGHTELRSNSFYHHQLEPVLNIENITSYCLHTDNLEITGMTDLQQTDLVGNQLSESKEQALELKCRQLLKYLGDVHDYDRVILVGCC